MVNYPDHPEEMAVVMRSMMAAELRRRTSLPKVAVLSSTPWLTSARCG
jgi:hypothetical protein